MESYLINTNDGIKHIDQIQFGILSSSDIAKMACVELVNRGLYNENKESIPYGPLDNKLGVNEKGKTCETCLKKIADCPGHFGYIRLEIPIFHIGYFKFILNILQCICKQCSRVLLQKEDKEIFRKSLRRKNLSSIAREKIFKNIIAACKKLKKCEFCDAYNGTVKHSQGTDATLIIHDKYNQKLNPDLFEQFKQKFESAGIFNKDIEGILNNKFYEELSCQKVYNLFNKIPKDEIIFFDMNYNYSNPLDLLVQYVIVPPLSIRPTVQIGFGTTNEDDLTIKLGEMIQLNKLIKNNLNEGLNTIKLLEDLSLLQHTHAQYINSDTKGLNKNILGSKPIRSLCSRLKGKNGRFRGNLSGKRVDFSGRTVISPDPNLKIDQVGVPVLIAKTMTFPQKVFAGNINQMRKFVLNGPEIYPGANFVEQTNGNKIFLQFTSRKKIAEELKIGDIIERHLIDDDIILFNRQPSLHRQSIMAFRAKVLPWRTLRFNECNCTPFNADFDGDEMNLHLPQTEEAKAEALYLMGVKENLITPKNAEPLIAATQDFLTTFYLITQKDFFIERSHFFMYLTFFNDANEKIEIPPPCILKPKEFWSGKQLFSMLLRPNRRSKVIINLEVKARNFSKKFKKDEFRCPNDGFVIIKNSELLTGNICKASIGSGSKNGIIFALIRDNNVHITAEILSRIAKFSSRWIGNYGMSFGIRDVYPKSDLMSKKEELVSTCYQKCDEFIESYNKGQIQLKAGMNAEQSLESILNKTLSDVRETIGGYLRSTLPKSNSALIMAVCGSKGSDINLSQMIACLGQQIVSGQRIADGFYNRTLPHFEPYSKYPAAKGFVKNSFYTGLNATEFFFHTIGGREGLVDTAVKTAETGYMQRRLVKALEDLTVQYDGTVTISTGEILQFVYGDDGIDPMSIDDDNRIINLNRLFLMTQSICPRKKSDKCLSINEIKYRVAEEIRKYPELNQINSSSSEKLLEDIRGFLNDIYKKIVDAREFLIMANTNYNNNIKSAATNSNGKANAKTNSKPAKAENQDFFSIDFSCDGSEYESEEIVENFQNGIVSITEDQLIEFFRILIKKFHKAKIVPGEAVGAVAAQSIGEPGTQMTLKTFHFAGVASMNITLGVPRIKEIINSTKTISTPVIYAKLIRENDLIAARIVKARIETTKLSEIMEYIKEVMSPHGCYLKVKLDTKAIDSLKLEINLNDIKEAILSTKKLKLKDKHIIILNSNKLKIEPFDVSKENLYFAMQIIKKKLSNVVVCGIPTVSRAVINKKETEKETEKTTYSLAIEGSGLPDIMRIPGIDHTKCISNNIMEVEKVLGIEAARNTIINEIKFTFAGHSIYVDNRHLQLIADLMTFKGMVLGFTRFGISKMKDSTLMHSSFEKTTDHLYEASFHSRNDIVSGVSECIIMGKMIPLGTGLFKTLYDNKKHNENILKMQEAKDITTKHALTSTTTANANASSSFKIGLQENIVEDKLLRANVFEKAEIINRMNFNLIDLIN